MPHRFLTTLELPEALARLFATVSAPLAAETVPAERCLGRVSARAIFARRSAPHYHGAAMDGIAVTAADTSGACEARPLRLEGGRFEVVDTGDALPPGRDAVIMVEEVVELPGGAVELARSATPGQHVRLVGEDVVAGEPLFPRGHRFGPADLGALLGAGVREAPCVRRPRVAVIATGDEIVEPDHAPAPGEIVETNSRVVLAQVELAGGEGVRHAPVKDDPALLRGAVERALRDADVVCVIAGSSAGRGDFTARVLGEVGDLVAHGLAIMPGKPAALAAAHGKALLGLPGFPVSCALVGELVLVPLLAHLLGVPPPSRERVRARLLRRVPSRLGLEELVRVSVARLGGGLACAPLPRGAGAITTLTRAHGLLRIPSSREGCDAGEEVEVELLAPRAEVEETLLHVGSHDPALDLLSDLLRAHTPGARVASSPVGSLAGLVAAARGECHFAGSHLLDPATGEYNLPELDRVAPGADVAVVTFAHRAQGLVVAKGNPLGLRGVADLAREGVRFVNRQRGSGTRVLLDHLLAQAGAGASGVAGYGREVFTHAAVAVAVQSGAADAGVAVLAAARALDLDFVPLAEERYDLVVPRAALGDPRMKRLLALLGSPELAAALAALGGYDARESGRWVRP